VNKSLWRIAALCSGGVRRGTICGNAEESNRPLKSHGTHILDHMDEGPTPGPIVIDNQSGGSVQVTVSRHMASQ
jgi:hypothetical protein